jgi:peptidoglycan-associated lipoprotein
MKKIALIIGTLMVAACGGVKEPAQLDGQRVYFAFDSAVVSQDAKQDLLGQSLYMKNHGDANIVIEGHCDERGSTEYNLGLGALRAGNAAHVLIADGIESKRIKTVSYGKERPQFKGTGEEVWAKNRNTTTRVVK